MYSRRVDKSWDCNKCGHKSNNRDECANCGLFRSKNKNYRVERKAGDWDCTNCNKLNFASRTECMNCKTAKPNAGPPQKMSVVKAGDWFCPDPACGINNFGSRTACYKCGKARVQQSQSSNETTECKICMNEQISRTLAPCGHACVCETCFAAIVVNPKCPICRQPVNTDLSIRTYLS